MKKKNILSGFVVVLLVVGAFMYLQAHPGAQAPYAQVSTLMTTSPYVESGDYYDIAANYATSTPLSPSANTAALTAMQSFVMGTVDQFKKDGHFADLTPTDVHMMDFDQGRKEKLQINYLIASSPRTISYIYTVYTDTLGAHGNLLFKTFTFDTVSGQKLSLGDLFVPGATYLDTLSSIARTKLPAIIGTGGSVQMLNDGTVPSEKNFANFFFDNKDFVILFSPYAVAPYAAGPQTLRIPVKDLAHLLSPTYRQ